MIDHLHQKHTQQNETSAKSYHMKSYNNDWSFLSCRGNCLLVAPEGHKVQF